MYSNLVYGTSCPTDEIVIRSPDIVIARG